MDIKDFTRGMGSVVELFPASNNRDDYLIISTCSDEEALKQDWSAIGEDIKAAIGKQEDYENK